MRRCVLRTRRVFAASQSFPVKHKSTIIITPIIYSTLRWDLIGNGTVSNIVGVRIAIRVRFNLLPDECVARSLSSFYPIKLFSSCPAECKPRQTALKHAIDGSRRLWVTITSSAAVVWTRSELERKRAQDCLTFSRRPELSFPLLIFLFLNTLIRSRISASPLSFLATVNLLLCLWAEGSQ